MTAQKTSKVPLDLGKHVFSIFLADFWRRKTKYSQKLVEKFFDLPGIQKTLISHRTHENKHPSDACGTDAQIRQFVLKLLDISMLFTLISQKMVYGQLPSCCTGFQTATTNRSIRCDITLQSQE